MRWLPSQANEIKLNLLRVTVISQREPLPPSPIDTLQAFLSFSNTFETFHELDLQTQADNVPTRFLQPKPSKRSPFPLSQAPWITCRRAQ